MNKKLKIIAGNALQVIITRSDYNHTEIAKKLGIDRQIISHLCIGRIELKVIMLINICECINISVNDYFEELYFQLHKKKLKI